MNDWMNQIENIKQRHATWKERLVTVDGIVRDTSCYSPEQEQTKQTFGFKWEKTETYESDAMQMLSNEWLLKRYFNNDPRSQESIFFQNAEVLDAGCGAGHSILALLDDKINSINYLGVDISTAVDVAKKRFENRGVRGSFMQGSIADLPFEEETFDVILSEGVLHHTDSTERTLKYLSRLLKPSGRFLFYVYAKKAPIREFTDDYVRARLQGLSNEEAWRETEKITKLGKALGDLDIEIEIPENIEFLGVQRGRHSLQRFFYYTVLKAFYRPELSIDEMNHINFDWFMPANCQRHTPEELTLWCNEAGMDIERMDVEPSGITVIAKKRLETRRQQ